MLAGLLSGSIRSERDVCKMMEGLRIACWIGSAIRCIAGSRRLSRSVATSSLRTRQLMSRSFFSSRNSARHERSALRNLFLAATKLLHAVSAKRKLLTCQRQLRSSLQSIMGATLTRRSRDTADSAREVPAFSPSFMLGVSSDFARRGQPAQSSAPASRRIRPARSACFEQRLFFHHFHVECRRRLHRHRQFDAVHIHSRKIERCSAVLSLS
jgi:hypothetical protein